MPLVAGSRLGPYEIIAPLGSGGMGEVWRARDSRLGRDVAIKILPGELAANPDRLARFEREAKTVASLNHPNIVTLHSIEEIDGFRFLTMELVEGTTLDQELTPGGVPVARLLSFAVPLADALVAAHERGVVHRDLKPANVMVTRSGRVKVLDFGLARLDATPSADDETVEIGVATPISSVGQVVGTVPYMAPEQLRGEGADARTDLFALGVIFYEMLSGRRPFTGKSFVEISSSILRDRPEALTESRDDLPGDLVGIVDRCLEKDPRKRFSSAVELHNELRTLQRQLESGSAPSGSSAGRRAAATTEVPSIAILPFVNRGRDEEDEYFADGLADELLNVLAKIRGLRVIARTSSFSFRGKDVTIAEIGRELGVASVLEGSIRKAANRIRINVQLVRVDDSSNLWSESYDRTLDDIFAVQDDIARSVVKELRTTLLGEAADSRASGDVKAEVAAAGKGRGTDPEAHRLYLQGNFHINRLSETDLRLGIDYLERAVARDPGDARAWAALARGRIIGSGWDVGKPDVECPRGLADAERALAIEPELGEGHLGVALYHVFYSWNWAAARAAGQRALERLPENPAVLTVLATIECIAARFEESLDFSGRAIESDPLNIGAYRIRGHVLRGIDRLDEALAVFHRCLELSPSSISIRQHIALVHALRGEFDRALAVAGEEPAEWARLCALGKIHELMGNRAESDRAVAREIELFGDTCASQIASIYATQGDVERMYPWIERAFETHDSGLTYCASDVAYRRFADDPRWQAVLRRVGIDPARVPR